jgi:hypothetical protein
LSSDGSYTYAVSNADTQFLREGEAKVETFTVASADGTTQEVSFTIYGTNDTPVITSNAITAQVAQGASSIATGSLFTAAATDADASAVLTYSLVDARGYFTIDTLSGNIGLTQAGAAAIAADPVGNWTLHVSVSDEHGARDDKTVTVDVRLAVDATTGTTAQLPGNVSDWSFQPAKVISSDITAPATDGFIMTRLDDPTIQVKIPHSVTSLTFNNATVGLNNNGTVGQVTVTEFTDSASTHTITVGTDAVGNAAVVLSPNAQVNVQGAADSFSDPRLGTANNVRSDTVVINAEASTAHFTTSADNHHITLNLDGGGQVILSDVEAVRFSDHTVRLVGGDGYATVAEAQAHAGDGDTVYVAPLRVANNVSAITGSVTEDGVDAASSATGTLTVTLANVAGVGPATWSVVGTTVSDFGSISVDPSTGTWQYHIDNTSSKVQALKADADHHWC